MTVEAVTVNPAIRNMDGVLLTVDADEAGQVTVGILCAQDGLVGNGELLTIRFRFADYYANGFEAVDLIVMEAYHEPLNGESYPIEIDRAKACVFVHAPTTEDVLAIVRHLHTPYTQPSEPWMDFNEDGRVTASDALLVLRCIMGLI